MSVIEAIRTLLKANLLTPRQAANLAVKYLKGGESTSAKRDDYPIVCPTCKQQVLPF